MGMPGPKKINRCGLDFKLRAVRTSEQPGVLIKDVAESLCIHPFMLSKWRRQVREGELSGQAPKLYAAAVAELQRLREVEGKYRQLKMEHDLLKKAIRFVSERKATSSPSSRQTGKRGPSR
jgi:transposase